MEQRFKVHLFSEYSINDLCKHTFAKLLGQTQADENVSIEWKPIKYTITVATNMLDVNPIKCYKQDLKIWKGDKKKSIEKTWSAQRSPIISNWIIYRKFQPDK